MMRDLRSKMEREKAVAKAMNKAFDGTRKYDRVGNPILMTNELLHFLRNPYGRTKHDRERDRLQAADAIESLQWTTKPKDKIKEDTSGDLRLPFDSDLVFASFAYARNMLYDYICEDSDDGISCSDIFYELEVPLSNYHEAFLLSLASKMDVSINQKFQGDEWAIKAQWFNKKTSRTNYKRIWTPGV